jgi:hypothetical protein
VPSWPLELEGQVFDGVEVISSCHVDVEEEILNPYGWVSCPIVLFYVYGFKPFWELMPHYLICKA